MKNPEVGTLGYMNNISSWSDADLQELLESATTMVNGNIVLELAHEILRLRARVSDLMVKK